MIVTRVMNRILAGAFFMIGVIGLVAGPINIYEAYTNEELKAAALASDPPRQVAIEAFNAERDIATADEVAIVLQALPARRVVAPAPGTLWLMPAVSTTETSPSAPPLAWILHTRTPWTAETFTAVRVDDGPAGGVVIEANGRLVDPSGHSAAFERATGGGSGRVPVIEPFLSGREVAFAPDDGAVQNALWLLLIPVLSFAIGALFWRRGRKLEQ